MTNDPVPLERNFSALPETESDEYQQSLELLFHGDKRLTWETLDAKFRTVILAEAGAGKSFEMEARARAIRAAGKPAFFIRIEDIDAGFLDAFEVGTADDFKAWLSSSEEGWFFLDSIDESRLDNPRTFEKSIKKFGNHVREARQRAHIFVSSRPYAWRDVTDRRLIAKYLPYRSPHQSDKAESPRECAHAADGTDPVLTYNALEVFVLNPLIESDIRMFAQHRGVPETDRLIAELQRTNLAPLAARPFDLEGILQKWSADRQLGGRLELLQHNIQVRLKEIDPDRQMRQALNAETAMAGARRLAAAVLLTGEAGLRVPDCDAVQKGVDAEAVLSDWNPKDVTVLLHRGIFNDPIYGMVRFRHREVRELLAAQWFCDLLSSGVSRRTIESLIFRRRFGETVLAPRLRPILPWLILFDDTIREKAVNLAPEVAVEGGDAAHLPKIEREALIKSLTERIANDQDSRSARDNDAIMRIAQPDLANTTRKLLERFRENDDVVFFLGRLVWQANMPCCLPLLSEIARDEGRGQYARIASIRAVMAWGAQTQKDELWTSFLSDSKPLSRRTLSELLDNAKGDRETAEIVLACFEKLEPYERFKATGLSRSLQDYVGRLSLETVVGDDSPLLVFINGLYALLDSAPYVERRDCRVSEAYLWLLPSATHAVDRLVSARSLEVFSDESLAILRMEAAARFWREGDYSEYKNSLRQSVPFWTELNDALFWRSIDTARTHRDATTAQRLTDVWTVQIMEHFWGFGPERFEDVLKFISDKTFMDDRLVALSLAWRIYVEAERPDTMRAELESIVVGTPDLEAQLDMLLNPVKTEQQRESQEAHEIWEREHEERKAEEERSHLDWINALQADPERVRRPAGLAPGQITRDQFGLMRAISDKKGNDTYSSGADWRALIPEFGQAVAEAYRDAAVGFWRTHRPQLGSDGASLGSTPGHDIFGLVGLEIEAETDPEFPASLSDSDCSTAARYFATELNGFPNWFERLFKARAQMVADLLRQELVWELENTTADSAMHYVLHDLVFYAPWMHNALSDGVLAWLQDHYVPRDDSRRYLLQILFAGQASDANIASLAQKKIDTNPNLYLQAIWYAVWVDVDAGEALPQLENWLQGLCAPVAKVAAQVFITHLVGSQRTGDLADRRDSYCTPSALRSLYTLMHRYIRVDEDIQRAGGGVYSPGLRDDAQDARDGLFNRLSEMRGKEVYFALRDLAETHPAESHRPWMRRQAQIQLEGAADLEDWTPEQVYEFDRTQMCTPRNHSQLFELSLHRLLDLKDWLEHGNDSPYQTWQKAGGESEMRNLIAGWLNKTSGSRFTCAQENELANQQRPDIWIQAAGLEPPVPIELKLLDKKWSGPKLCERLRNQLAGDYLREENAKCGVFLLVWQGSSDKRAWTIDGKRTGLENIGAALVDYWGSIADQFPGIDEIEVIVIDLTVRDAPADT